MEGESDYSPKMQLSASKCKYSADREETTLDEEFQGELEDKERPIFLQVYII